MPIYEYNCRKCGHEFEALQRMGDRSCPPCEKCGAGKTERRFSTFAMHGAARPSGCGSGNCESGGCGTGHGSGGGCGGCSRSSCAGCKH